MARVQILQLPTYGRDGEQPFALIVDGCENSPEFALRWERFGETIAARGVLVTPQRIDIDTTDEDSTFVEFDHGALMESVKTAVRAHLESAEASDAFRADIERRPVAARNGR